MPIQFGTPPADIDPRAMAEQFRSFGRDFTSGLGVLADYAKSPLVQYLSSGPTAAVMAGMQPPPGQPPDQPPVLPPDTAVVPKYPPADAAAATPAPRNFNPDALSSWKDMLQQDRPPPAQPATAGNIGVTPTAIPVTGVQDVTGAYRARTQPAALPVTGVQDVTDAYRARTEAIPPPAGASSPLADRLATMNGLGRGQPNIQWQGNNLTTRQWDQQAYQDYMAGRTPDKTQTLLLEQQTPMDIQSIAQRLPGFLPYSERLANAKQIYAQEAPTYNQQAQQASLDAERTARLGLDQQTIDIRRQEIANEIKKTEYDMSKSKTLDTLISGMVQQGLPQSEVARRVQNYRANDPQMQSAGGIGVRSDGIGLGPTADSLPSDIQEIISGGQAVRAPDIATALDRIYAKYGPQTGYGPDYLNKLAPAVRSALEVGYGGNAVKSYALPSMLNPFSTRMQIGEIADRAVGTPGRNSEIKAWARRKLLGLKN
jgi:hypothetical protein